MTDEQSLVSEAIDRSMDEIGVSLFSAHCRALTNNVLEALNLPSRDAAMRAEGRAEGLREAAKVAGECAERAWDDARKMGEDTACASGRNYGARSAQAAILALIPKESSDER